MPILQKIYEKNGEQIIAHDKFIYCSTVYKIWSWGASLLEEKYYSSDNPITFKKKDLVLKQKDYRIQRFIDLKFAPEEFLKSKNYKLL